MKFLSHNCQIFTFQVLLDYMVETNFVRKYLGMHEDREVIPEIRVLRPHETKYEQKFKSLSLFFMVRE
jgi:hypothetical protein